MQLVPHFRAVLSVRRVQSLATALLLSSLAACASLGSNGPTTHAVRHAVAEPVENAKVQIIPITAAVAHQVRSAASLGSFADALGDAPPAGTIIGRGDVL